MGYISSFFVERFLDQAPEALKKANLLRTVGLPTDQSIDPEAMVSEGNFFDFLEQIAAFNDASRCIAVQVGSQMRCDDYGAFGLAFKSAVTLEGSYKRVERFGKIVTSIANFSLDRKMGSSFMRVLDGHDRRLGLHMTNELAVAAAIALSREVTDTEFNPIQVTFAHKEPSDASKFERLLGCPVEFGAKYDGFEVSDNDFRKTNRLGDQKTSEFFDLHLEGELSSICDVTGLAQRVRNLISTSLSEGVPLITDTAAQLGMSGRSLQRRLSEEGYSYQYIVDDARRVLAERLLRSTTYSLAEISFLTGYSEQSTFSKAFKRWHGKTPRSYRLTAVQ